MNAGTNAPMSRLEALFASFSEALEVNEKAHYELKQIAASLEPFNEDEMQKRKDENATISSNRPSKLDRFNDLVNTVHKRNAELGHIINHLRQQVGC